MNIQVCSVNIQVCSVNIQVCSVNIQVCSVNIQVCSVNIQAYSSVYPLLQKASIYHPFSAVRYYLSDTMAGDTGHAEERTRDSQYITPTSGMARAAHIYCANRPSVRLFISPASSLHQILSRSTRLTQKSR